MIVTLAFVNAKAQDTTLIWDKKTITLPEVFVRNNLNYSTLLKIIQDDTTFYKAFKNLRVIGFTSLNDIIIYDKEGRVQAASESKSVQHYNNGCRSTEMVYEKTEGDFYNRHHQYNYTTAEMYASLFFTKGKVCGETNIIGDVGFSTKGKSGIEKNKEQLKMLFFNPGKKISGIPFIGNKLDLYDERAAAYYDYKLDYDNYKGKVVYVFSIVPKEGKARDVVINEMTTWFDMKTMQVLARNYSLSYKAGVYDFDVQMEVKLTPVNGMYVPEVLRYKGNWNIVFKKRERAIFTATLFDFKTTR